MTRPLTTLIWGGRWRFRTGRPRQNRAMSWIDLPAPGSPTVKRHRFRHCTQGRGRFWRALCWWWTSADPITYRRRSARDCTLQGPQDGWPPGLDVPHRRAGFLLRHPEVNSLSPADTGATGAPGRQRAAARGTGPTGGSGGVRSRTVRPHSAAPAVLTRVVSGGDVETLCIMSRGRMLRSPRFSFGRVIS